MKCGCPHDMSIPCYLSWCASVRRRMFWRMGIRRQSVFPFPVSEAMRACSSMERMAGRAACWTLVGRTYPHSARAATGGRGTQDRVKKGKFYKNSFCSQGSGGSALRPEFILYVQYLAGCRDSSRSQVCYQWATHIPGKERCTKWRRNKLKKSLRIKKWLRNLLLIYSYTVDKMANVVTRSRMYPERKPTVADPN